MIDSGTNTAKPRIGTAFGWYYCDVRVDSLSWIHVAWVYDVEKSKLSLTRLIKLLLIFVDTFHKNSIPQLLSAALMKMES